MSSRHKQKVSAVVVTRLTEAQRAALQFGHEIDGVHPRRGQSQMFERLRLMGLLADAGVGLSTDGHDRQVQLYAITTAGRTALVRATAE